MAKGNMKKKQPAISPQYRFLPFTLSTDGRESSARLSTTYRNEEVSPTKYLYGRFPPLLGKYLLLMVCPIMLIRLPIVPSCILLASASSSADWVTEASVITHRHVNTSLSHAVSLEEQARGGDAEQRK